MKKTSGQMLVELLIGIGIVLTLLVGVAVLSTQTVKTSRVSGDRSEASALAEAEMELVRKDRETNKEVFFNKEGEGVCLSGVTPKEGYACEVVYRPDGSGTTMEVTVTISWQEAGGDSSLSLTTDLTRR
jgi:type II secretory pathway pseudopilin PulG